MDWLALLFDMSGTHHGPSSRVALPSAPMSTEEVFKTLGRYAEDSRERYRQTATKLGVNRTTLTAPASNGLMSGHAFLEYRAELMNSLQSASSSGEVGCLNT